MTAQPEYAALPRMTPEEYLAFDRASDTRHEYHRGYVVAMAGASEKHNRLIGNFHFHMRAKIGTARCRIYLQELRVALHIVDRFVYPDVTVVCGEAQWLDGAFDTLVNPTLLVEVLAPSTEQHDRGTKLFAYQRLASLQDYLLVHQASARVEHFSRETQGWHYQTYEGLEATLDLPNLGCALPLSELYEGMTFDEAEDDGKGVVTEL